MKTLSGKIGLCFLYGLLAVASRSDDVSVRGYGPFQDENRLSAMEGLAVGELPSKPLTFLTCLACFNDRVNEARLPASCRVMVDSCPSMLIGKTANLDLSDTATLAMNDSFDRFGLQKGMPLRPQLGDLDLRTFLALVVFTFDDASVAYPNTDISVGYGWGSPGYVGFRLRARRQDQTVSADGAAEPDDGLDIDCEIHPRDTRWFYFSEDQRRSSLGDLSSCKNGDQKPDAAGASQKKDPPNEATVKNQKRVDRRKSQDPAAVGEYYQWDIAHCTNGNVCVDVPSTAKMSEFLDKKEWILFVDFHRIPLEPAAFGDRATFLVRVYIENNESWKNGKATEYYDERASGDNKEYWEWYYSLHEQVSCYDRRKYSYLRRDINLGQEEVLHICAEILNIGSEEEQHRDHVAVRRILNSVHPLKTEKSE